MKNFDIFGIMVDGSRNAVMTVKELKKLITLISKMGYNQIQLLLRIPMRLRASRFSVTEEDATPKKNSRRWIPRLLSASRRVSVMHL